MKALTVSFDDCDKADMHRWEYTGQLASIMGPCIGYRCSICDGTLKVYPDHYGTVEHRQVCDEQGTVVKQYSCKVQ